MLSAFYNKYSNNKYHNIPHRDRMHMYLNHQLAYYCMPTLLKLKSSSLFRINKKDIKDIVTFLKEMDHIVNYFECKRIVLYEADHMLIILIYNEVLLREVILSEEEQSFLKFLEYPAPSNGMEGVLDTLRERYRSFMEKRSEFPHEIGIILGYPLKDVKAFICNKGKNYIICGCWKVYHDVDTAKNIFERYQRVREKALRCILSGRKLQDYYERVKL